MPSQRLFDIVGLEIGRFSGLRFELPLFPRRLEDRFEADTSKQRCMRLWLEGLFTLGIFDLFLIADLAGTPATFWRAVVVRLGIITPVGLLVNFSMRRNPNKIYREASIGLMACAAGLSHLYLEGGQNEVVSAFAQLGLVAVILVANTLMRLRFVYAFASTSTMLLGDLYFLHEDRFLTHGQKILGLCLAGSASAVTMISNYSSNREERLNYLLCLRGDLTLEELNRSNERLKQMAESDALTGLANRHYFDGRFAELWQIAVASSECLSLVVVDVDHFKTLNDTYGHLYGDRVLHRIGRLLAEALRQKDDLAARFGGEEFVVLLPATNQDSALLVAERLRRLVEVAGLPALDSSLLQTKLTKATVSCGVATAYPVALNDHKDLLDAADKALYQAKKNGRNCVCLAGQTMAHRLSA